MNINLQHTATVDLTHVHNDSINYSFEILDIDLNAVNFSAYTAGILTIKENELSTTSIVSFTSTGATYQIDITDASEGKIRLIANTTSTIPVGTYVYDLQLYNSTVRETVLTGTFTVVADIS